MIGTYDTPGEAYGVEVVGNTAYVADGTKGLQIIDITTPSSPSLISTFGPLGLTMKVQVVGTKAYVAALNNGLQILDISSLSSPILIGTYDTPDRARHVQVVGTTAYVADGASGLQIINVASPSSPSRIGFYDTPGEAMEVQVVGTAAFVADSTSSLQVIDVSSPTNPTLFWTYIAATSSVPSPVDAVHVVGTTAYLAISNGELRILTNLNQLKLSGTPGPTNAGTFAVTLNGITSGGVASTSFNMHVRSPQAPIYQNPISMQRAEVDQYFEYVMPNNVFANPNGGELTYKTKDLPKWLTFNPANRTFYGQPQTGDTGMYTDQITVASVIASDGTLETTGQFKVSVSGDSYAANLLKFIKIIGPILSTLTLYRNRALFINRYAKRKWSYEGYMCNGEHFIYKLQTKKDNFQKIQAYVRDKGHFGQCFEKLFCGKRYHVEFPTQFPQWMRYDDKRNVLYSTRKLTIRDFDEGREMQMRIQGSGGVIKEVIKLVHVDSPNESNIEEYMDLLETSRDSATYSEQLSV